MPNYPQTLNLVNMQDKYSFSDKTLVIFRKIQGEILALFPLELGTSSPYTCSSYAQIGQHGTADALIAREGKLASFKEYKALANELRKIGYKLQIGERVPRNALEVRRKKLAEISWLIIL